MRTQELSGRTEEAGQVINIYITQMCCLAKSRIDALMNYSQNILLKTLT